MKRPRIAFARVVTVTLSVILLGPRLALGEERPATSVAGERFSAHLRQVSEDWRITFQTAPKAEEAADPEADTPARILKAEDLVRWGWPAETSDGAQIALTDGGLLIGEVVRTDQDRLIVESDEFGEIKIPLELVAGILFHPPGHRPARDSLIDALTAADRDDDLLLLNNGDRLQGTVLKFDEKEIQLRAGVGDLAISRDRIRSLAFNPALFARPARDGLAVMVGWRDGTRILATSLVLSEVVQLKSAGGLELTSENPGHVVYLQPLGEKVEYLSDLKPDSYRHVPFLSLSWPFLLDRNVTGGHLRSAGHLYLKGIGMHSAARLTFNLDGQYQRFDALAALDDQVETGGSVTFRVFVDGKERYATDTMRGGEEPTSISVPVAGARRMSLIVDFADHGDQQDHANWLDARLVR